MSINCPQCGVSMPDNAAFCPGCGLRMFVATPDTVASGGLKDHWLGALAYVTFIPALVFVLVEPYKRNRFIRFHSFQSLFLLAAGVLTGIVLRLSLAILSLIPHVGYLLGWLAIVVVCIGWLILWMVLLVKALQGAMFKLPWLGDWAEAA